MIQEAAGVPLDPSFEEQKKIMLRCKGLFYACKGGAEARRFNRLADRRRPGAGTVGRAQFYRRSSGGQGGRRP